MEEYRKKECRYCLEPLPGSILDLGSMPLANSFLTKEELAETEFSCPLSITRCDGCGLVQLTHVVPAEKMFSHYLYVSSTSPTFRKHFEDYAVDTVSRLNGTDDHFAVDIGSNDGLLLSHFIDNGIKAIGVEPAKNLSDEANEKGLLTINRYFDRETVKTITGEHGKASIITANNVFAHIDDIHSVCVNVNDLLRDDGMFIIEFPYLVTMVEEMLFDMIYHEHLSYISITPLAGMLKRFGLSIFDIKPVASHGGSLRVFIQKESGSNKEEEIVAKYLNDENAKGFNEISKYIEFASKVMDVKTKVNKFIDEAIAENKTVVGYGAPAKGNTLINFCGLSSDKIKYIVDDNPLKQNMYSPGANIPIVDSKFLETNPADYLVIFAWNFAKDIIAKMGHLREKGVKFIVPLPEPTIV
ncbi:MAG: class I SAM-dependent methyltransferase [Bacteroidetes bacterium]|nr:class I SAM-dependent methyltransferase [Bacteroidota bacterium]